MSENSLLRAVFNDARLGSLKEFNDFHNFELFFKDLMIFLKPKIEHMECAFVAIDSFFEDEFDSACEKAFYCDAHCFYIEFSMDYATILLYSLCERFLNAFVDSLSHNKRRSNIEAIKEVFLSYDIDITCFAGYKEFDKLRLISNSIKHSGYPDSKLIALDNKRWNKEKEIHVTESEILDLYQHVNLFLTSVFELNI